MLWAIGIIYVLGWIATASYGIYYSAREFGRLTYGPGDGGICFFMGMIWPLLCIVGPIMYVSHLIQEAGYKAHDDPQAQIKRDKREAVK